MEVEEFTYGTLQEGASAGAPGFYLQAGKGETWRPIDILQKIRSIKTGPVKIIRLAATDAPEEEILSLVKTLGDMGFVIQAVSDGGAFLRWYHNIHHLIVDISSPVWLGFNCQELWMDTGKQESVSDPTLPGGKIQGTMYYIKPTGDSGEIYRYIVSSKIPWAVIPRPFKAIKTNLIEEE